MTVFQIAAEGADTLVLDRDDGWRVRSFEWVSGTIRPSVQDAPDADGTIDTTMLRGAGTITLGLRLLPASSPFDQRLDRLRLFTHGRLRPTLTIDPGNGQAVKVATLTQGVVTCPVSAATHRDAVVQWKVPHGILESADQRGAIARASGTVDDDGFTFPLEFDLTFPPISPQGEVEIVNAGTADAYPLLRLYGPWSDETEIENVTQGLKLVFDGLTIDAGEFLAIDVRAKTIFVNGDPTQSAYRYLVFPGSAWWTLQPGPQRIRFAPETFTEPASAEIVYRDAWL